ncbi:restriction endonuclease FokI C-terminal domain-containing protein (plasmid) [Coraliomargarita sp. W4R53]
MVTKQYWMFSRPQRKLYRLPLTVTALHEAAGEEQWQGERDRHVAFEELLEREGIKRAGARREGTGSGGRTHAALVRSLGFAFDSSETGKLELTLAGLALAEGDRPVDILKNQVLRFQYPSPYSLSRQVQIDPKFKVRPFILLLRLLLHPSLDGRLTQDEVGLIVLFSGTGDAPADADRVAQQIAAYRATGLDEAAFLALHGKGADTFDAVKKRYTAIANTAFNWFELTGVIERERQTISLSDSTVGEAEHLLDHYSAMPRIPHADDVDRFQRAYGLPPGKRKDTRNLSAATTVSRAEFVLRRVTTIITRWSSTELLIDGATPAIVDRLTQVTQFDREEVATSAAKVLGSDRTLDSYLTHYQSLVYATSPSAAREFEQVTAEIIRRVFQLGAVCVGQTGRHPDIVVTKPNSWRGIIDTKAYGGEYSLPSSHDRAMREYVETYVAMQGEPLRFWAFIAGAISRGAGAKAHALAEQIETPGIVIGMLAWLHIIRLGQANKLSSDNLAVLFSSSGELTLADLPPR